MTRLYQLLFVCLSFSAFAACTPGRQLRRTAAATVFKDSALLNAHIGISIFDAEKGTYLYNYQGDKYFVPASNVKLFTCYVGMKYLGDSLAGIHYQQDDTATLLFPAGDPTFLHPDFKHHRVLDFLQQEKRHLYISSSGWKEQALGFGWAWDDYSDDYMAERSPFPLHGNMALYKLAERYNYQQTDAAVRWTVTPAYFSRFINGFPVLPPATAARLEMRDTAVLNKQLNKFWLQRSRTDNRINLYPGETTFRAAEIPVYTDTVATALEVLINDYSVTIANRPLRIDESLSAEIATNRIIHTIHSQRTDSMLKPMMHRSDNFYAEQTLLMASNRQLDYMKTADIIDTVLKSDLKDLPQQPKWVDGSGLSRYNLFTPQSFVQLLLKMKTTFGMERLKTILPTGGSGTLRNYYQPIRGSIFAKTGTLSNNCALSGYLITKKGKLLIFSVLANNYQTGSVPVRRAVERFLMTIWKKN